MLNFSRIGDIGGAVRTACRRSKPIRSDWPGDKINRSGTDGQTILQTNNHVLSGPQVRFENFWGTVSLIFSRDDKSLESKPDEPSKNELKKRAKAAEKEKKAAEKAAKLAEQQREREEAEEVWSFFHSSRLHFSQP